MKCRFRIIEILCLLGYLSIALPTQAQSQTRFRLQGTIKDAKTNELLEFATVLLQNDSVQLHAISDTKGSFSISNVPVGTYSLGISFIGYTSIHQSLTIRRDTTMAIALQPDNITLKDIIVTASESRGLTTSSKINRKAMELLQPSSFTDILALLPGGRTKDPALGGVNQARLREVGISSNNYDISSLGTAFLVNGVPINTDANMQHVLGASQSDHDYYRNSTGKGVDMRMLSTDFIESVEVIRGIPSVEYGELTSGVIKIQRKAGAHPRAARRKPTPKANWFTSGKDSRQTKDGYSTSASITWMPRLTPATTWRTTNVSRQPPTWPANGKQTPGHYPGIWTSTTANPSMTRKAIPTSVYKKIDKYKSSYHRMSVANTLQLGYHRIHALEIRQPDGRRGLLAEQNQANKIHLARQRHPHPRQHGRRRTRRDLSPVPLYGTLKSGW